jgi:membrane protease YdiL (CAAX protease family)
MSANWSSDLRRLWRLVAPVGVWIAWTMLAFLGLAMPIVGATLGIMIAFVPPVGVAINTDAGRLVATALIYTIALLLVALPYLIQHTPLSQLRQMFGIAKRPPAISVGLALMALAVYLVGSEMVARLIEMARFPWYNPDQTQELGFTDVTQPEQFIVSFLALVIIAPLAEEMIFRGFLYGKLRRTLSFVATALIVSATFGLAHGQWNVGIDVAILSLVLCWLREKTGSIWVGALVHALKNLIAYLLIFVFKVV